jgi:calcium-dependent protein kinase
LRDKGYEGFKVDVWSAGVCLYAMLIGTVPFKAASMHELHNLIINGKYEFKDEHLSEMAKDLISKLLQTDPKKRLSAFEVLGHPWLKDVEEVREIFT